MACQFSLSGSGLSGLPGDFPAGALLILTDQNPPLGHDPRRIGAELGRTLEAGRWAGVLLDLEREATGLSREICAAALEAARKENCFCAMPEAYAARLPEAAIFAPLPALLSRPGQNGRQRLWELAPRRARLRLEEGGCRWEAAPDLSFEELQFDADSGLAYAGRSRGGAVLFDMQDTRESLLSVLDEPETLGGVALPREWALLPSGAEAGADGPPERQTPSPGSV